MDGQDVLQQAAARYGCIVHPEASFYRARRGESAFSDLVYDPESNQIVAAEKPKDGLSTMQRQRVASMSNRRRADRLNSIKAPNAEKVRAAEEKRKRQHAMLDQLRDLAAGGLTRAEIATRMGMSPSTVSYFASANKIAVTKKPRVKAVREKREPKPRVAKKAVQRHAFVKEQAEPLLRSGMSVKNVAAALRASCDTVRAVRNELGIAPIRREKIEKPPSEHKIKVAEKRAAQLKKVKDLHAKGWTREKIQSELRVGKRVMNRLRDEAGLSFPRGFQSPNPITEVVLEKAKKLRADGFSYHAISHRLCVPLSTLHTHMTDA